MDADQMDRFFDRFGDTLSDRLGRAFADAQAAANAAAETRAANERSAIVAGLRGAFRGSGGREFREDKQASDKEDLVASVIKQQSHTVEFLKDNIFDPDRSRSTSGRMTLSTPCARKTVLM